VQLRRHPEAPAIPRRTPYSQPVVQGPQTAIVVGPAGDEIYTDEHARVKVHFHWDRHDKSKPGFLLLDSRLPILGRQTMGHDSHPPHWPGVIVEFLEGDPDEPIITGRVYNADQVPPPPTPSPPTKPNPASKAAPPKAAPAPTSTNCASRTKKGGEMVTLHAEKDQEIGVEKRTNPTPSATTAAKPSATTKPPM